MDDRDLYKLIRKVLKDAMMELRLKKNGFATSVNGRRNGWVVRQNAEARKQNCFVYVSSLPWWGSFICGIKVNYGTLNGRGIRELGATVREVLVRQGLKVEDPIDECSPYFLIKGATEEVQLAHVMMSEE